MTTRYDPEAGEIQLYADKDYATDEPFYMYAIVGNAMVFLF